MTEYSNPTPIAVHLQPATVNGVDIGLVVIDRADGAGWAFPAGYIENGLDQSAETAAAREFHEETGIIACPGKLMGSTITPSGKILLFVEDQDVFTLNLACWQPTSEALAIRIAVEPEELCYPAHTEAMRAWFEARRP